MKTFSIGRQQGAFRPVSLSGLDLFAVVADWLEAMQGRTDLDIAFGHLVCAVGADAGSLVRTSPPAGRPTLVRCHDRARSSTVRPLDESFAAECFGQAFRNADAGSILTLRDDGKTSPGLSADAYGGWSAIRGMQDMIVLILASSGGTHDHMELHFSQAAGPEIHATLAALLPTMARGWAHRRVGLVSTMTGRTRQPSVAASTRPAAALSAANPFRLSRAEFRICVLLSRGHSVASIGEETGLSEATIRSHLRSVYIKTSCSSLAELVFRLLDGVDHASGGRAA